MYVRTVVGGLVVASVALATVMLTVAPSEAHPAILLLVFLLLYVIILLVLLLGVVLVSRLAGQSTAHPGKDTLQRQRRRAYMYASVVALAPVIGVAINTVGGVSYREILLIVAFEAIALFYVWKRQ